jgi:ketosteroid isomerase-like protein
VAEHPNAAIVRRMIDAFNTDDMEQMAQLAETLLADDIVWHEIGRSEPRRGKDELRASMGEVDYQITGRLHDIVAGDDHAIALVDATATRGGRTLHYRVAEIYHIRDGRIAERWAFSDDTAAIVAFFA